MTPRPTPEAGQGREGPVTGVDLAGLELAPLTRYDLVDRISDSVAAGRGGWVITANVDILRSFTRVAENRRLFSGADLIVADGVPLLWAARAQGTPLPDRVAGSDLVWLLAERAARDGRSLYLLGGQGDAALRAREKFLARWPDLQIDTSSPLISAHPTPDEVARARDEIAKHEPDLVFVGLGAPKQERLIDRLHLEFPHTWWMGVGICLGFVAGHVDRAPRWLQQAGLEWVHRLVQEPRRLARRYLVDDLPFALALIARSFARRGRRPER